MDSLKLATDQETWSKGRYVSNVTEMPAFEFGWQTRLIIFRSQKHFYLVLQVIWQSAIFLFWKFLGTLADLNRENSDLVYQTTKVRNCRLWRFCMSNTDNVLIWTTFKITIIPIATAQLPTVTYDSLCDLWWPFVDFFVYPHFYEQNIQVILYTHCKLNLN